MALSKAFMLSLFYCCTIAILISKTQAAATQTLAGNTQAPAVNTQGPKGNTQAPKGNKQAAVTQSPAVSTPSPLNFKCSSSGKIQEILDVNKTDILILNGANYCHLNDTGCDLKNKTKVIVLYLHGEKSPSIAGGKNAHFYQLECQTAGSFVANVSKSIGIVTPAPNVINHKPTDPTTKPSLTITDKNGSPSNEVHIGDPLLLKITGPDLYIVEPIKCTANSASSSNTDYVLWTDDSCSSKDEAVIENTWKPDNTSKNVIAIHMYGFRFVDSDTVEVKCSALFCPKDSSCPSKHCVNGQGGTNGRKKRNTGVETKSKNGYLEKHISTLFRVTDNRIETSACSGTFASVFTYVTVFALMLTLK